ncbi:hypothetical protein BDR22DRAFT_823561 [Usnea florida]
MANIQRPYGRRLLPQILDELAQTTPHRLYAAISKSTDLNDGFKDVTIGEMAVAVNCMVYWLQQQFVTTKLFETISYIGLPDLRYTIYFLAAIKCRYKILFPSPKNPAATNACLLQQTSCKTLFYSREMEEVVKSISTAADQNLHCVAVPSFDEMIQAQSHDYPYMEKFEDVVDDPVVILHSSGSTGIPRAIHISHGCLATLDNDRNIPTPHGRRKHDFTLWNFAGGGEFYAPFPPYHLAGFCALAVIPLFSDAAAPVLSPPGLVPNGSLVCQLMAKRRLRALFVPPLLLDSALDEPDSIRHFKKLDFVCFAGGQLSKSAGDTLSKTVTLCQYYGATEMFQVQQLVPNKEDWDFLEWHPDCKLEMQPSNLMDGAYELVLQRDFENHYMAAWMHLFKDDQYKTKDLFIRHPKNMNLWRFCGRSDDIIVLSNAAKFNPIPMERTINTHPQVRSTLVGGQGRPQGFLLIEPTTNILKPERSQFVDLIWPIVERGNSLIASHGRIIKSHILLTSVTKPLSRTPKGTIVRRLAEQQYATEIEEVYTNSHISSSEIGSEQNFSLEPSCIETLLRDVIAQCLLTPSHINANQDLFHLGLDSLKANQMANLLRARLEAEVTLGGLEWLKAKTIYRYPTVEKLTIEIIRSLDPDSGSSRGGLDYLQIPNMATILEGYTSMLNGQRSTKSSMPDRHHNGLHIALTGSSGSLGSQILKQFPKSTPLATIYCLDRPNSPRAERLGQVSEESRGSLKVYHLTVDLLLPHFGLPEDMYNLLGSNVNIFIHAAYPVDFNLSLSSFDLSLRAIVSICHWSLSCQKRPRIIFISSVSSVVNYPSDSTERAPVVPEELVEDYTSAAPMGYGQSKLIAENILGKAASQSGVRTSILRVGQIAGSTQIEDAAWPEREWFPSLVKTCRSLKMVPDGLPTVDWIPIDLAAKIVLELALADSEDDGLKVYNVINPRPTSWSTLVPSVLTMCGPHSLVVSLHEWLGELDQTTAPSEEDFRERPAHKLLDFFTYLSQLNNSEGVGYATTRLKEVSASARGLEAVGSRWMETWGQQWGFR